MLRFVLLSIRSSVCLSVPCLWLKTVNFRVMTIYRLYISLTENRIVELQPTSRRGRTVTGSIAETGGAYRFTAIWAINYTVMSCKSNVIYLIFAVLVVWDIATVVFTGRFKLFGFLYRTLQL